MKVTFEGKDLEDILSQMMGVIAEVDGVKTEPLPRDKEVKKEAPPPVVEAKPVEAKPKNKGGRPKGYSPKKNGAAVAAKVDAHKNAADKAKASVTAFEKAKAKVKAAAAIEQQEEMMQEEVSFEDLELPAPAPEPEPEPEELTPVQLAAIRVKTTEELQAAYAAGKHAQVLALLKKHGNGATSFRALHIEDFVPIRKAIDAGALA